MTILEQLKEAQVLAIVESKERPGSFDLIEWCDTCFSATLTPAELRELARELVALADGEYTVGKESFGWATITANKRPVKEPLTLDQQLKAMKDQP